MHSLHALEALLADLSPWLRYLMVAICERHLQQADLRLICQTQLDPELERGDVPGREGWTYARKFGQEVMVTRTQGRVVWLNLDLGQSDEQLERMGLLLEVLPGSPGLPEGCPTPAVERLRRWMPARELLFSGLEQLEARGLIESVGDERLRLAPSPLEALSGFQSLQDDSEGYARFTAETDDERQLAAGRAWLLEHSENIESGALARTHEELEPEDVERIVTKFLGAPLGGATIVALRVAQLRDMPIAPSLLQRLVEQIEPTSDEGAAVAIMDVAEYALRHDVAREATIERLLAYGAEAEDLTFSVAEGEDDFLMEELQQLMGGVSIGLPGIQPAARLLLEHAPSLCLPTVRRALRDPGHIDLATATRLVAIGQPWAIREVEAAVQDVANPSIRHAMIALLDEGGHKLEALRADATFAGIARQRLAGQEEWAAKFRERVGEDFEPEG